MAPQITLNRRYLKYAALLAVLALCIVVVNVLAHAQGRQAGQAAEESVSALFRIDFDRPIAGQLPPCTETGAAFWRAHLASIRRQVQERELIVQHVEVTRNGPPQPYDGLGGSGQIVPVALSITTLDQKGQPQTAVSETRVLMIEDDEGQWLLDGLAPDLPPAQSRTSQGGQ